MNEHFPLHPRTEVAMRAFGMLLARDLEAAGPAEEFTTVPQARMAHAASQMLQLIDQLSEGGDMRNDASLTATALSPGSTWLDLAEAGLVARDFIEQVVEHVAPRANASYVAPAASPTPLWARSLMHMIDVAGDEVRDDLALSFPEYVGLMRACQTPTGMRRLLALVEA